MTTETFVDETFERARRVADTIAEVTVDSVKQSQEVTAKAFQTLTGALLNGLGTTSPSDVAGNVRETVNASYDLAKQVINHQLQVADKVMSAVTGSSS
jgi:hypothetical protein